jgi:DNA-binding response OmpR family regulator
MSAARKFLIVDDNPDSRFLLVKTLLRKFPHAIIHECQDGNTAINLTKSESLDALIVHRAEEVDGLTLIRTLHKVDAKVPIVMVSGIDRSKESLAAGATCFLSYEAWLRIGTIVAELLPGGAPTKRSDASPSSVEA